MKRKYELVRYTELMNEARQSFYKYFPLIIDELLQKNRKIKTELIEPAALWDVIQNIFDNAMNTTDEIELVHCKNRFKNEVLRILFKAGIPFVDGKSPVFWSTRFARKEATQFAVENDAVTDCMAQEYLNKLLVGQEGKYNVLFLLANPSLDVSVRSEFPKLVKLFCGARSEAFAEEISPVMDAHIFFQDSLRIDNFFWNYELPVIRARGIKIIAHRYDFNSHSWQDPVDMDSEFGQQIFVRRRLVCPDEPHDSQSVYNENNGLLLWSQKFKDNSLTNELESWSAPKILTLARLRHIFRFWVDRTTIQSSAPSKPLKPPSLT